MCPLSRLSMSFDALYPFPFPILSVPRLGGGDWNLKFQPSTSQPTPDGPKKISKPWEGRRKANERRAPSLLIPGCIHAHTRAILAETPRFLNKARPPLNAMTSLHSPVPIYPSYSSSLRALGDQSRVSSTCTMHSPRATPPQLTPCFISTSVGSFEWATGPRPEDLPVLDTHLSADSGLGVPPIPG